MSNPIQPESSIPAYSTIVCRFGELFLKGGNRSRFEQRLVRNIQQTLSGIEGAKVRKPHGRIVVKVPSSNQEDAMGRLQRVFGLVSLSPAVSSAPDMASISAAAIEEAKRAVARDPAKGKSFKVQTKRSNKNFPLNSLQVSAQIGSDIHEALGIPVDVNNPALTVGIEIGDERTSVFADRRPCAGGLPAGTAGKGLLLLSGGIDSPVAGWHAAKRGLALEGIYFHSPPFVGQKTLDKVLDLGRALNRWNAMDAVWVVPFTEVQKKLRAEGQPEMAVVLYRRMMMRIADRIADRIGAKALVTGENLGQVASQTLGNMATISEASKHLILRPLVTFDKVDTIKLAKQIGTYALSTLPFDDCCALFVPKHPNTGASVREAAFSEKGIDLDAEADAAAEAAERFDLRPQRAKTEQPSP